MAQQSVNNDINLSKSDDHSFVFELYQYGEHVGTLKFGDYKSARRYYCSRYFTYDIAIVPYVDGIELTFNQAYQYFSVVEYHMRNFGKRGKFRQ